MNQKLYIFIYLLLKASKKNVLSCIHVLSKTNGHNGQWDFVWTGHFTVASGF